MQTASAEEEVLTRLKVRKGANTYEVEAISSGLSDLIKGTFEHWFSESRFISFLCSLIILLHFPYRF